MKILSSEVSMEATSSREMEFKITNKSTSSFEAMIFKPSTNEINDNEITSKNLDQVENKTIVNNEKDLPIYALLNKFIIEILLARFLGDEENEFKLYPKHEITNKPSLYESDSTNKDVNVLSQIKSETVIQTKMKFTNELTTEYYKKNSISFGTKATIKTADKDIEINLNLSYTQEFYEAHKKKLEFEKTVFLDPLVIHYDLTSNYFDSIDDNLSFEFDINNDNKKDTIAMLKDGSGFLALDKNSNGTIDNGKELFGTITNNGFDELTQYDEDNNGWIDENDSVFKDLRIWNKSEGNDSLIALGDANVGAIYLSDISSNFNYDKSVTQSLAHLKSTSIFLTEDGEAGLVKGIDFAVS